MRINSKKSESLEYVLMVLLLSFSGNPFATLLGKFIPFIISAFIIVVYFKKIKIDFYRPFLLIASALMLLYLFQLAALYYVSWLAGFRYIVTFLFGGLVFYLLAERFTFKFFIVIYYVSCISLVLFVVINLLHFNKFGIQYANGRYTWVVYTLMVSHILRNAGMFWEPGAFAGVLSLCIALNVKDFASLWKNHRFKVFIVLLALLTTKSTTGYINLFITSIYYCLFFVKSNLIKYTIMPALVVVCIIVYTNLDFLHDKLESQSESSQNLANGEYSSTRFGSLMFDLHYIKKHPIVGNGFSDRTRLADNPELIGQDLGNGNGFSNYMACLGIPFMFFYFLLSFMALNKFDKRSSYLVCLVIMLSLFSEQWLNFPLYAGIIFINKKKRLV